MLAPFFHSHELEGSSVKDPPPYLRLGGAQDNLRSHCLLPVPDLLEPPPTPSPQPSLISTSCTSDGLGVLMRLWVHTSGCLHTGQRLASPALIQVVAQ